jgi:Xaa-Pro aminopeptidase
MKYEITPRYEIYSRISKLQKQLSFHGITGALISQNTDLFYYSGTIQRSFLYIPDDGEPVLAVTGNLERAKEECKLKYIIPMENLRQLDKILTDFDYSVSGKVGLEMDVLPATYYVAMQKDFSNASFVDISEIVRKQRMIKSAYELQRIRMACKMQSDVMEYARQVIKVGMTELDIDAVLTAYIRRRGHQGQFRVRAYNQEILYSHVLFGKNSALSSYVKGPLGGKGTTPAYSLGASFNVITENQPLIVDFGVGVSGYISDMTRTFVIGRMPRELEKAHQLAREVKHYLENEVKPGKSIPELYQEIIKIVNLKELSEHFMGYKTNRMPFLGHGIGLELDEYPVIADSFNEIFQENMVFSFEPKFAFPEKGAVGVEDDYVVTASGLECLTLFEDNILVIKK